MGRGLDDRVMVGPRRGPYPLLMTSLRTLTVVIVLGALLGAACSSESSPDVADVPPSDAAVTANQQAQSVPEGYRDCGTVNLTSGWPTTTVFIAEQAGECIVAAEESGQPAQQSFSGRDSNGGIYGQIVRVNGPADMAVTEYQIDAAGNITSTETRCPELVTAGIGPPSCPQT